MSDTAHTGGGQHDRTPRRPLQRSARPLHRPTSGAPAQGARRPLMRPTHPTGTRVTPAGSGTSAGPRHTPGHGQPVTFHHPPLQQQSFTRSRTGGSTQPLRRPQGRPMTTRSHGTGGHAGTHFGKTRERTEEMRTERKEREKKKIVIPPLGKGDLRIVILGGVEEIGRNMAAIETENDILIVDCGLMFKDEDTPGVDFILPNTEYLEERKEKIRAVVITHGHLDHIGGLPYILGRLGNPPVYARNLTGMLMQKRHDEFPSIPKLDLKVVETTDRIIFQDLAVRFFKVTHTIPDSMGVIIETPHGVIVHTGDLKLDHMGGIPLESEEVEYAKFKNENVLLLMADSTNCQKPGFSIPEPTVHKTIEELIRTANGRVIVATFASLLERIMKIIEFADTHGKKVVIDGRSMKTNIEIAQKAGLFKFKKGTLIPIEEMESHPADKIVMLVTGAQGDAFAVLMRAAMKKHKNLKIREGDTVLFSSSVVPGNERAVQKLKDLLSRQGGKIVHYETSDVHSSGHSYRDETQWIIGKIRPRYFIPLHGYHYMLRTHVDIAMASGIPKDNCLILDDGGIAEIRNEGKAIVKLAQGAAKEMVTVDGFAIGNVQEVVIRDRQMLAIDGIVVLVATVDLRTGKLMKSPDIIARGFVYVRESQELLQQARLIVKKTVEDACGKGVKGMNFDNVKEDVRDRVGKFLYQKTNKQPMIIPVLLGI